MRHRLLPVQLLLHKRLLMLRLLLLVLLISCHLLVAQ